MWVVAGMIGVKQSTVSTWARRGKWAIKTPKNGDKPNGNGDTTVGLRKENLSERVKQQLEHELARQAQLLSDNPPRSLKELANAGGKQGRTAVAKNLAETGGDVFGWNSQPPAHHLHLHTVREIASGPQGPWRECPNGADAPQIPAQVPTPLENQTAEQSQPTPPPQGN